MDTTIPSTATDCLEEREPFTEQYNAITARTTLSTNHALAFPKKSAIIARINPTHASLGCSFGKMTIVKILIDYQFQDRIHLKRMIICHSLLE